jgi:Holliday junction resolvasome RuvABC endonuclease subunit
MRCIGLDPGVHLGWAVLESVDGPRGGSYRPRFVDGGVLEGDHLEVDVARLLDRQVRWSRPQPLVVAVESVEGYAHDRPGRSARVLSKRLHECAHLAGVIEGISLGMSLRVARAPASIWRKRVCGKGSASDVAVKAALGVLVADLPTRTSVHLRDAAGCAFAVLASTTTAVVVGPA